MEKLNLPLTIRIFKESTNKEAPFIAYNPELDISSCGMTEEKAQKMLQEAIETLLKGARKDGTLNQLLEEAGLAIKSSKSFSAKTYFSVFNFSLNA